MLPVRTHHFLSVPNDKQSKPTLNEMTITIIKYIGPWLPARLNGQILLGTQEKTCSERIYFDHEL